MNTPANHTPYRLNGQPLPLATDQPLPTTLAELVALLATTQGVQPERIATAVNGEFVAISARAARVLHSGDEVMTFQPIFGG
ncbi:sulfur carrier protein ThiS [Curvibacter sp. CHRR-16]|uniref:sulfur carrier protein ThiS n=1 Tax=Curvibacter sp. CHRR-16 TaxID=2835872 RepID=UPI001BDAD7D2|nr:sulfur carrier protein ThiS [Curvibacter sp. CHRR-16]MBT0568876.1 sulfur carrier protein ThiS [Curvibacter sp. CHRR-16]